MSEAKTRLQEIRAEIQALKKQAEEKAKAIFHEESSRLFEAHPCLSSFSWTQYTPYFNDGDACTFSSQHDCFSMICRGEVGEDEDVGEPWYGPSLEDNEIFFEEAGYGLDSSYAEESFARAPGAKEAARAIKEFLSVFDCDDMENMFGDHACVTVTKDGVDVSDYDHE